MSNSKLPVFDPQRPLLGHVITFAANSFNGTGQVRQYDTKEGYMRIASLTDAPGKPFDQWFPCRSIHVSKDAGPQPLPPEEVPVERETPKAIPAHTETQEKLRRNPRLGNRGGVDHGARAATEADFAETDAFASPSKTLANA